MVLPVYGGVPLDDIVFPETPSPRYQYSSWNFDNERQSPRRTVRQGNRRPRPPMPNEGDPFAGLEPQNNNRPFSGNQGQWSNQRPNQQQGSGNRPSSNQNQWGTNGNNQGQNQWGSNGNNQGQNQWATNGVNQGQNQWGTNGNNQGQNQLGTNGNNQGQNQWGTNGNNLQGQNQWGTNGDNQGQNNQGNRPTTQPTGNQNLVQTSTTSSNSEEVNEAQRNTCNTICREKITNEYNPVCGSDSQTYQNRRFLDCVANCGIRKYCYFVCNSINTPTYIQI